MAERPMAPKSAELTPEERADIDGMYLRLASATLYEVLGVTSTADRRAIRDAYFALSQRFHPDAYFGRDLGAWKPRVEEIFREATRAYEVLSHRNRRAEYDQSIAGRLAAAPAAPVAPVAPVQPEPEPVLPPAPVVAPVVTVPAPRPVPSVPAIAPEVAQRAAREALARKLGVRPAAVVPPPPPAPATPSAPVDPLASLRSLRTQRLEAERGARLAQLTRTADDSLARNDLLGASNALAVAVSVAPEDAALRTRAEEVARRLADSLAGQHTEEARAHERGGEWSQAALCWQKVVAARPDDATAHERAAHALWRAGRELPRAAELARRATQLAPTRVDAYVTLAQVFAAGGLKASALGALDTASKLDPASVVVKDLLARLKG